MARQKVDKAGERLLSSGYGRVARLRSIGAIDDGDLYRISHLAEILSLAISPDGTVIAIGSQNGSARLWSVDTRLPLGSPMPNGGQVRYLAFDSSGHLLLSGAGDGSLRLWDVRNSQPVGPWQKHRGPITAVGFDRAGRFLECAVRDNRLWSIPAPVRIEMKRVRLWAETVTGMELSGGDAVRVLDDAEWNAKSAAIGLVAGARNE